MVKSLFCQTKKFSRIIILLNIVFLFSCRTIKTVQYEIEKEKTETEFRILQISDFHSNDFGKNEEKIITKIKNAKPHLIVITGDLFDHRQKEKKYFPNVELLLQGIQNLCPIFFVTGNHDFIDLRLDEKYSLLQNYGVQILHDEATTLSHENNIIIIAGIHDPYFDLGENIKRIMKDQKEKYRERLQTRPTVRWKNLSLLKSVSAKRTADLTIISSNHSRPMTTLLPRQLTRLV